MRKSWTLLSGLILSFGMVASGHALASDRKQSNKEDEPFFKEPFFNPDSDVFKEMNEMHQLMQKLMDNQLSKMQDDFNHQYPDLASNNLDNIQIKEDKEHLVYKIKLPKGADNKINVTVQDGQLVIDENVVQKTIHKEDNKESIRYSQNKNIRSLPIPSGYDAQSMHTEMKEAHLIITLKKIT